jgi:hypothetical protein
MAMPCSVCHHEQREKIDAVLVEGRASNHVIARQFGLGHDAIARHRNLHISKALAKVVARREAKASVRLVDRIETLVGRVETILENADQRGSVAQALTAVRELRGLYELVGKISGELKPDGQVVVVNLQASAEWIEIRSRLLGALQPFPEARARVALALTGGELIDGDAREVS